MFADAVTSIFDKKFQPYPLAQSYVTEDDDGEKDCSWFARWMSEVTERWTTKAQQNTDGDKLHILIQEVGQFEDVNQVTYWSPIGWDGEGCVHNGNGPDIGKLMVLNVRVSWRCSKLDRDQLITYTLQDFLQASKPSLLSSGLPPDLVESWVEKVQDEAVNPTKHMLMKWVITWATKRPDLALRPMYTRL